MNRALFLDRDGVVNELVYYADTGEYESPRTPGDFQLCAGVLPVLKTWQQAGWLLFLVSNQPSYAKGKVALEDLQAIHAAFVAELDRAGIQFRAFYYDYTHPQGIIPDYTRESIFRKPNPGFLLRAQHEHDVELTASWMIGDRDSDVICGQRAGCQTVLITHQRSAIYQGHSQPTLRCCDLVECAAMLP